MERMPKGQASNSAWPSTGPGSTGRIVGSLLRPALGDPDHCRTEHALAYRIAGLHDLDHRVGGHIRIWHLEHRLVEIRIELFAFRLKLLHAMTIERGQHRALGDIDTLDEGLEAGIAGSLGFSGDGVERAAQIVGHRQHVAREIGDRISAGVMYVARGAPAKVLHVRRNAQGAVLQFLVLLQKPDKSLVIAVDRSFGPFGSSLGSLVLVRRAFVFCVVAHHVRDPAMLEVMPRISMFDSQKSRGKAGWAALLACRKTTARWKSDSEEGAKY